MDKLLRLQAAVAALTDDDSGKAIITYASVCAGSDLVTGILRIAAAHWKSCYNLDVEFRQLFAAEIVPFKQMFIMQHWQPSRLFCDVCELCQDDVLDLVSGERVAVPTCDILIAGFECDNFSALNQNMVASRGCIKQGAHWPLSVAGDPCDMCC